MQITLTFSAEMLKSIFYRNLQVYIHSESSRKIGKIQFLGLTDCSE